MLAQAILSLPDAVVNDADESVFHVGAWSLLAEMGCLRYFEFGAESETVMADMVALGRQFEDGGLTFALGAQLFGAMTLLEWDLQPSSTVAKVRELSRSGMHLAHAISEPESGSDVFSMRSVGVVEGDWIHVFGTKTYVSGGSEAEWALVYVMTDSSKGAMGGMSAILLHKDEWTLLGSMKKMGLRSCSMSSLAFDVRVPRERVVGKVGGGYRSFMKAMDWERTGLSAVHVGTMERVFAKTVAFANLRHQGGCAIAKHQAVAFMIAEMKIAIETSRVLVEKAAATLGHKASSKERTKAAAMAKLHTSEHLVEVCKKAMQIHGGSGYVHGVGPERWMRDALAATIYSGTSEIQRKLIAGLL